MPLLNPAIDADRIQKLQDLLQKVSTIEIPQKRSLAQDLEFKNIFYKLREKFSSVVTTPLDEQLTQIHASLKNITEDSARDQVFTTMEKYVRAINTQGLTKTGMACTLFNTLKMHGRIERATQCLRDIPPGPARQALEKEMVQHYLSLHTLEATEKALQIALMPNEISIAHKVSLNVDLLENILMTFIELDAFEKARETASCLARFCVGAIFSPLIRTLVETEKPEAIQIAIELTPFICQPFTIDRAMQAVVPVLLTRGATRQDLENFVAGFKDEQCREKATKSIEEYFLKGETS